MYTLQGGKQHAVAFFCKDHGHDASEVAPTPRSMSHDGSHANGGGQLAIAFNLRGREDGAQPEVSDVASLRSASGGSSRSYVAHGNAEETRPGEVLFELREALGEEAFSQWGQISRERILRKACPAEQTGDVGPRSNDTQAYAVRRLSVVEAARLQGFPDEYTYITMRPRKITPDEAAYLYSHGLRVWQKGEQWMTDVAADGPQYRALGNSWAIPVVRWIAERLACADDALGRKAEMAS